MLSKLPIAFVLYTSTKGHFGRKGDWRITLDHWDRQVPLAAFGQRIAHVKISSGDHALGDEMTRELERRGFYVIRTLADWSRGMAHQTGYMGDLVTVTKDAVFNHNPQPFYLHVEDDSPMLCHTLSLEDWLLQSCHWFGESNELVTVRARRRCDDRGPESCPKTVPRGFWSSDVNLQPMLMRSLDAYRLGMILEANPQHCQTVQCERLIRLILDTFSRSPRRHLVWECDEAETVHIGVPQSEHEAALKTLSLA